MANRAKLQREYMNKPIQIEMKYSHLNLNRNYIRSIALDNTLKGKWDTKIDKPAYDNLSFHQLADVVILLSRYYDDEAKLLADKIISNNYRNK